MATDAHEEHEDKLEIQRHHVDFDRISMITSLALSDVAQWDLPPDQQVSILERALKDILNIVG